MKLPAEILRANPDWEKLTSSQQDELREGLRQKCRADLYFLAKGVLGYDKLVPRYHGPLCRIIQDSAFSRKLLLLPRGTFKTSLCTKANSIRQILEDPNTRILIANATQENASKILWEIRSQFEKNKILQWLFPEIIPDFTRATRWNNQEILVRREQEWSEATVEAIGVGGNVTSRHYNVHYKDDIIDEKIAESPIEMQRAKDWLSFTEGIFVNPGTDREYIIGTRYALNDPYGDILSDAIPQTDLLPDFFNIPFVSAGYQCFMRAAVENGQLAIPELLDELALQRIKKRQGKRIYSAQFLNFPFTSETKSFDRDWLKFYDFDDEGNIRTSEGSKVARENLYITMRVDPSSGESKTTRDRSAIIVDGVDSKNRVFVLEAWAERVKWHELFEKLCQLYRKWHPAKTAIEQVAMAKVMGSQFREYARKQGLSPYMVELRGTNKKTKESRISAYDARFEAGEVFIRRSMENFLNEYVNFPDPSVTDDLLDAFAYGDQVWMVPADWADVEKWEAEERQVLQFRRRSITGY